jgi:hypothetical protein
MRPIDEDTAYAIEEAAKCGGKMIDAGTKVGSIWTRVM